MLMQIVAVHLLVLVIGLFAGFWFSDGKLGFSKTEMRLAALIGFMMLGLQFFIEHTNYERAIHLLVSGAVLYVGINVGERFRIGVEKKFFSSVKLEETRYTMWTFIKSLDELVASMKDQPNVIVQFKQDFLANYDSMMRVLGSVRQFGVFIKDNQLVSLIEKIEKAMQSLHLLMNDEEFTLEDIQEIKLMVKELQLVLESTLDFTESRFEIYRDKLLQLGLYFFKHGRA